MDDLLVPPIMLLLVSFSEITMHIFKEALSEILDLE